MLITRSVGYFFLQRSQSFDINCDCFRMTMFLPSNKIICKIAEDANFSNRLSTFFREHQSEDPVTLRLRIFSKNLSDEDKDFYNFALLQLEARKKYCSKFHHLPELFFPSLLAGEQASNSFIAQYHAELVQNCKSLLDLTAGLGVDFMCMAKGIDSLGYNCVAVERDLIKCDFLRYNLDKNGLENSEIVCGDAMEYLENLRNEGKKFDCIYVDPSRRDHDGKRLYDPHDCQPDVIGNSELLFQVAGKVIIKNSPMLDINKVITLFPNVVAVHIVSYKNECKELLVECQEGGELQKIVACDIHSDGTAQIVEMTPDILKEKYEGEYPGLVKLEKWITDGDVWLYEPSVSHMKIGAWNFLAKKYGMIKCSPNSHIFISTERVLDFPGRIMKIECMLDRRSIKRLQGRPRNVVTRNYPLKAAPLSKKLKVNSGDDKYIYGLTLSTSEKPILLDTTMV